MALALESPIRDNVDELTHLGVRRSQPGISPHALPTETKSMPLAAPRIVLTNLAVLVLILASTALADGPPRQSDAVAPPESYSSEKRSHWAYQPIKPVVPPRVKDVRWVRNPIDRFILSSLEEIEWSPAPEADRVALIRRVTFDLTGLPPSAEQVAAFLGDSRPDAFERLVDRLLASPQYGERWGQHWLDLAHYADSNGYELDAERPDAWRYRDWVVDALNRDLPYDRFLMLQLAGDDIQPGDRDALIATGFCRCGPREVVGGNVIPEEKRQSELSEITGTVGSVFLGLTIGCARCHDHKFDAIPTTDYYRLQAFFAASKLDDLPIASESEAQSLRRGGEGRQSEDGASQDSARSARGPLSSGDQGSQALHAQRRGADGDEHPRTQDARPAQKKLAQGLQTSLRVTWEEVAAAVAADQKVHARRESIKRGLSRSHIPYWPLRPRFCSRR